jgi:hypothetical protein
MNSSPLPAQRFALGPGILSSSDKDGTAVLHVGGDKMYSVIGLASLILTRLARSESGLSFDALVDDAVRELDQSQRQETEGNVARLLSALQARGIVQACATERPGELNSGWTARFALMARRVARQLLKLRLYNLAAFLGLFATNIILKLISFAALYHLVKTWPTSSMDEGNSERAIERVRAAVDRATTWYPKQARCLQRSAVTVCLLRSYGVPAQMVIGVNKVPFKSHAWAEVSGEVVNDLPAVAARYRVLDRC